MKDILNISELAILYYEVKSPGLYDAGDTYRRTIARANFKKAVKLDPDALKAAKEKYLKILTEKLDEFE